MYSYVTPNPLQLLQEQVPGQLLKTRDIRFNFNSDFIIVDNPVNNGGVRKLTTDPVNCKVC